MPDVDRPSLTDLPRVLGPFDACMVVVGSIIGSGIFFKPALVASKLPSFGLIIAVWLGVGLVTLCGSLALAELGAMMPRAGGPYLYLREAFGPLPAFLWGWTEFLVIRTGSIGALATATTLYLNEVVPMSRWHQELNTLGLVALLVVVNVINTRWGARVQNLTALIKVGFLGLIIIAPLALGRAETANLQPLLPEAWDATLWRGMAAAMIAVMWPYDGWVNLAPVTEEIRDPHRNVPLALLAGIGIVIAVYVLTNVSYHLVLPFDEVARSEAVAADLFRALWGSDAGHWAALGVMCSAFGAVNANMLTGPRIYFAMARDGLLPRSLRQVHARFETPANAIIWQGVWTMVLIFVAFRISERPSAAFDTLTNFVIVGGSVFYALAVASVFVLRRTQPDAQRPYRTWGYPWTPALYLAAFGVAVASLLVAAPLESLAGGLLIAGGIPVYAWMRSAGKSGNLSE